MVQGVGALKIRGRLAVVRVSFISVLNSRKEGLVRLHGDGLDGG